MFSPPEILARSYGICLKKPNPRFVIHFSGTTDHGGFQYLDPLKVSPEFHLRQTGIPDSLIAAYRSAHYQAGFGPDAIALHVDQYSEPLSQLFAASGHRCAAFITACNPFGMRQSPEVNRAGCARLRDRLSQYVSRPDEIIEGIGFDPSGDWPREESFLVPGLDRETSRKLGEEFHQNAIVWAGADAVPKLILLR